MKRFSQLLIHVSGVVAIAMAMSGIAHAVDLSQPVILVASSALDGSPFEQTVVLAAPLPDGSHVGFIVNRPTTTKLQTLFPDDIAARKVKEPVYLGGPGLLPGVFAVTPKAPDGDGIILRLMPGLVLVVDAASVDRVIKTAPSDARFFLGLMLWDVDDLESEVHDDKWDVRPADVDIVMRARSSGLWNSLRGPWVGLQSERRAG